MLQLIFSPRDQRHHCLFTRNDLSQFQSKTARSPRNHDVLPRKRILECPVLVNDLHDQGAENVRPKKIKNYAHEKNILCTYCCSDFHSV